MKYTILALFFIFTSDLWSQDHYAKLKIEQDTGYAELSGFFKDSMIDDISVFMTGENHSYAVTNSKTEFRILRYLHEQHGVNHFLFEQGPAIGYIIDKITIEKNLDYAFYLEDRFYAPFFEMVKKIRDYNDKQVDSLKIHTHGIDVERYPAYAIFVLNDMVDSLSTKGETGRIYESIKALGSSEFKDASPDQIYNAGGTRFNLNGNIIDAWNTFNTIIYDTDRLEDSLKADLGDNFPIFKDIVESIQKGHQWFHEERDGNLTGPITRERFMVAQFERLTKRYVQPKFYGQFGRCHLHSDKKAKRCYSYDMVSIAQRIGEIDDPFYKNKVLAIPVLYQTYSGYERQMIASLGLDYRFEDENEAYLIDVQYLKGNNPLAGFSNTLPYLILNTYEPEGFEKEYEFNFGVESTHLTVGAGLRYFNKFNTLNFELGQIGANEFATGLTYYEVAIDYYDLNQSSFRIAYSFIPEVSNGDRFSMRQSMFALGSGYSFGIKRIFGSLGMNFSYGQTFLTERRDELVPNLIQLDNENITIYKNDLFLVDPYLEGRINLPFISVNAKVGYAFDVSGKFWKLGEKVRDFTKTSFSNPYFMVGASIHFDNDY